MHSVLTGKTATSVTLGSKELLAFVGTDYLGMAHHPKVLEAASQAFVDYGLSPSASRITSGSCTPHEHLEEALAEFMGLESAVLLPSGGQANLALMESLIDGLDVILLDADAHPTLVHAARLNGSRRLDYGAGDGSRLMALLDRFRHERILVVTDSVFPTSGRMAPIPDIVRDLPEDGLLLVDESHSLGVVDPQGRGAVKAFAIPTGQVVVSLSLAKALGAFGGALVGPASVIQTIKRRSETYATTTPIPPAMAAAALASLRLLEAEPSRVQRLHRNIQRLHEIGQLWGRRPSGSFLPVLNRSFADEKEGRRISAELLRRGIYVPFTQYPGTPLGGALRFSISSEHSEEQIARLEVALKEIAALG
ncbi:MAG: pyridoxal phosphate-dependent aminotransferase family protein [Planctomycetota bacterium]|nr:pyridoxal phosphate-dependent aminotransferase family protein [Planctomycetota bacterium]